MAGARIRAFQTCCPAHCSRLHTRGICHTSRANCAILACGGESHDCSLAHHCARGRDVRESNFYFCGRHVHGRPLAAPLSRPSRFLLARSFKDHAFATHCQSALGLSSPALADGRKMLKTRFLKMAAQLPSQADKKPPSPGSAAEPPWAAPTARRPGSRSSFAPNIRSVAAASVPNCGRHGRRLFAA